MGTRGVIGFTVDGKDHFAYNHFDSYPSGLGQVMVDFVRKRVASDTAYYADLARRLKDINGTKPNDFDKARLKEYTDLGVSTQSDDDWYCLLRGTQYDPDAILQAGYYENSNDFIADSLFCEYAYVINFDTGKLELYEGFQKEPHEQGRFADAERPAGSDYYPCALKAEYEFDDIPPGWAKVFEEE